MDTSTFVSAAAIARICHEANRAYCISIGDFSQKHWEDAPQWQHDSAIAGVEFRVKNPYAPPSASHEQWLQHKLKEGWVYGPLKDEVAKTHPCIKPFNELPFDQQRKDCLFAAIVASLTLNVGDMK